MKVLDPYDYFSPCSNLGAVKITLKVLILIIQLASQLYYCIRYPYSHAKALQLCDNSSWVKSMESFHKVKLQKYISDAE